MRARSACSVAGSWGGIDILRVWLPLIASGGPESSRSPEASSPLFSVRLDLGASVPEGRELEARGVDRDDARVGRQVDLEAVGVGDLGDEAHVGDGGLLAQAEAPGRAPGELDLQRLEAFTHPVAIPLVAHGL